MSLINRLTGSKEQPKPAEESVDPSSLPVTVDEAFFILANNRRRILLNVLHGSDEPVSTTDLAVIIASAEHGSGPDGVPDGLVKSARVALLQDHYPLLGKHGLIEETDGGVQPVVDLHPLVSVMQQVERVCQNEPKPGVETQ